MSRELKFRAYYGNPGESQMKYNVGVHPFMIFRLSAFDIDIEENHDDNSGDLIVSTGAYNVMQYTGLKDNNGKEVYEGDIFGRQMDDIDGNCVVCYIEGILSLKCGNHNRPLTISKNTNVSWCLVGEHRYAPFEVLGNIYENPELLTK